MLRCLPSKQLVSPVAMLSEVQNEFRPSSCPAHHDYKVSFVSASQGARLVTTRHDLLALLEKATGGLK